MSASRPTIEPAVGRPDRHRRGQRWVLQATTGIAVLWLVFPLLPVLVWAFAQQWTYPAVVPQRLGLRGWSVVADPATARAIGLSAALGALVALAATALGAVAGRALGWRLTRRPTLVALLLLSPVALPPFAIAMGLGAVILRARVPGLAATAVILTVFALPYTSYVFAARYTSLDPEAEDQARLLGATRRQAFARVTVPALRPAIAAAAFLAFLVGWSDYVVTLVIGGGQIVTLPMLIASAAAGSGNEPILAALSLLSVLPPLLTLIVAKLVGGRRPRWTGRQRSPRPGLPGLATTRSEIS